ncbi:MAG: hypothetical protein IJK48_09210 [Bacteroidales bacterium]|nr:hypothetical protein [Bacteroidales bacterium]
MAIAKENKVVHGNDLTVVGLQIKAYAQPKEEGKGLSKNDYTDEEKQKLGNIAPGAQVNVIEAIQVNGDAVTPNAKVINIVIPVKISDLANDSAFIDKTVADLTNYYSKSQLYTKSEVDEAIQAAVSGEFVAAQSLPVASAETMHKIYLIPNGGSAGNSKDEYVTTRSGSEGSYTYAWEKIGTTDIDLSGYVTSEELEKLTSAEVVALLNI